VRPLFRLILGGSGCFMATCQRPIPDFVDAPDAAPPASSVRSTETPLLELGRSAQMPTYRVRLVSQRECSRAKASSHRSASRSWAAELEVTNTSRELVPVNPFYATVQDEDRFSYTTSLADCGTLLASKLLVPGESVRGFVPFELPSETRRVVLTYRPFSRGNVEQSARFALEP
jgi:hypothetical protein